jgi:uncharacterized protein YecE (DUF72 family)
LVELYVGAGGWAYFIVPGESPLKAYSKTFNFVEVNSTFYELPHPGAAEAWRRAVPQSFRFAVRANKAITHDNPFTPSPESEDALQATLEVCQALKADVLHFQTPQSFRIGDMEAKRIGDFFSTLNAGSMILTLEVRGASGRDLPHSLVRAMQDNHILHCVDLLKGEAPAYAADTLYARAFGKGDHNIYQPDDGELRAVEMTASRHTKAYVAFHGAKMYSDAARLVTFGKTGKFPMVTRSTGLNSLASVLEEDAKFPANRDELIKRQGWKLFDASEEVRTRAEDLLRKLPDRTYGNVNDLLQELHYQGGGAG